MYINATMCAPRPGGVLHYALVKENLEKHRRAGHVFYGRLFGEKTRRRSSARTNRERFRGK